MHRDFLPSSVLLLVPALLGGCALAEAPGEISSMSSTMTGMAGDVQAMNASLGVTNDSLGTTNDGLAAMDERLAAMLQQLQGVRASMQSMTDALGALDVMVGQMDALQIGSQGLAASMETTNALLGDVLIGINATSSGMTHMGEQLETMLAALSATNAGLHRMSGQLETLGPSLIADAMPEVEKGIAAAGGWVLPVGGALVLAWLATVALLWRIGSAVRAARPRVETPARRETEALFDPSAGTR